MRNSSNSLEADGWYAANKRGGNAAAQNHGIPTLSARHRQDTSPGLRPTSPPRRGEGIEARTILFNY